MLDSARGGSEQVSQAGSKGGERARRRRRNAALREDTSPALPGCAGSLRWQLLEQSAYLLAPPPAPPPARRCQLPAGAPGHTESLTSLAAAADPQVSVCLCAGAADPPESSPGQGWKLECPVASSLESHPVLLAQALQVSQTRYASQGLAQPCYPGTRGSPTPFPSEPKNLGLPQARAGPGPPVDPADSSVCGERVWQCQSSHKYVLSAYSFRHRRQNRHHPCRP